MSCPMVKVMGQWACRSLTLRLHVYLPIWYIRRVEGWKGGAPLPLPRPHTPWNLKNYLMSLPFFYVRDAVKGFERSRSIT